MEYLCPPCFCTYTPGGSVLNQNLLWRLPNNFSAQDSLYLNQRVVSKRNDDTPIYHTRTMIQEFVNYYSYFMQGAKPYEL